MEKKLIYHHNLIGHEINESLQFYADEIMDREVYCRKMHAIIEPKKKDCEYCPYFAGLEQGHGHECRWEDIVEQNIVEQDHLVIQHEERYREYERVDKLIKRRILKSPSQITELYVKNKPYDKNKWKYEHSIDERYRYVLGTNGKNPLICIGVNPSTASPGDPDKTMKVVSRYSKLFGYDSYIMINLYPQRATHPVDLDEREEIKAVETNIQYIRMLLQTGEYTIWAAWGDLIYKRDYLRSCLEQIINIADMYLCKWISVGSRTKKGNPHHPLYLPQNASIENFDIHDYISKI